MGAPKGREHQCGVDSRWQRLEQVRGRGRARHSPYVPLGRLIARGEDAVVGCPANSHDFTVEVSTVESEHLT
jgi:hypothetical protein